MQKFENENGAEVLVLAPGEVAGFVAEIEQARSNAASTPRDPEVVEPRPWRAEVMTSGDRAWVANGLRFATRDEALTYASDLSGRWMAVTRWRAADDSVPLRQPYEAGSEDGSWS